MNKRMVKNSICITLCALFVYGYFHHNQGEEIKKEVVVSDVQNYKQIVYIDQDGILVPISCPLEEYPSIQSETFELFNLMKNPDLFSSHVNSVIPKDTHLESVIIDNGLLELHFNELKVSNELRFLEAIAFVFNQLEEVDGVELFVSNKKINKLPEGQIVFNAPLTNKLGINNFETAFKNIHQTKNVTVYYTKEIEGMELYVPVSKRIDEKATFQEQLNEIVSEVSVSSTLNKASLFESVDILDGSYLQDGHLYVNMNHFVLLDENTINSDVYDLLLLSFSKIDGVEKVTILVDEEIMETRDTINVSNIIYNVVKI